MYHVPAHFIITLSLEVPNMAALPRPLDNWTLTRSDQMKTSLIAICVNVAWLVIVHGWPDCSVSNDAHVPYNGTQARP